MRTRLWRLMHRAQVRPLYLELALNVTLLARRGLVRRVNSRRGRGTAVSRLVLSLRRGSETL